MKELLLLDGVSVLFHARRGLLGSVALKALDRVSISVARGETVALVGESGSGKTTLGRVSLRLLQPTEGRVLFDGQEITALDDGQLKAFRRRAQGIFQDPYSSLDGMMNLYQLLEEPLIIHRLGGHSTRRELVRLALEEVKLTPAKEFATKYPHMLSGGQRQRAGVARALILRPDYIVADEPVSMIDASSRAEILYLLRELQERHGIAFMYITHDIATAHHFSHRVAVMYLGHIVELGPTREVIRHPLHPYTQGLIRAVPVPDPANRLKERRAIPGEPPSLYQVPRGCRFHPRCHSFMRGQCELEDPTLHEVGPGHHVACLLYR